MSNALTQSLGRYCGSVDVNVDVKGLMISKYKSNLLDLALRSRCLSCSAHEQGIILHILPTDKSNGKPISRIDVGYYVWWTLQIWWLVGFRETKICSWNANGWLISRRSSWLISRRSSWQISIVPPAFWRHFCFSLTTHDMTGTIMLHW